MMSSVSTGSFNSSFPIWMLFISIYIFPSFLFSLLYWLKPLKTVRYRSDKSDFALFLILEGKYPFFFTVSYDVNYSCFVDVHINLRTLPFIPNLLRGFVFLFVFSGMTVGLCQMPFLSLLKYHVVFLSYSVDMVNFFN